MKNMRLESLEKILKLGNGWEITPAGGATGEAYIAQHEGRKLFLKRNSSPFLAVLSAEGIVPKLVWTKRMANGDVITAQHWLEGRELKPTDMNDESVAKLLSKIHHSKPLLDMLKRINTTPLYPSVILEDMMNKLDADLISDHTISAALALLQKDLSHVVVNEHVVCHCDVNHNNWLLSNGELYLIDWDGARVADPALDLGLLLHFYIPREDWECWLNLYGTTLTNHLNKRMKWYAIAESILTINWNHSRGNAKEMERWMNFLKHLCSTE